MKYKQKPNIPTDESVLHYVNMFDNTEPICAEDRVRDRMMEHFDWSFEDIYAAVVVVNDLFGTQLRNTFAMARHIFAHKDEIRQATDAGLPNVIAIIARGHGIQRRGCKESVLYSFATKFCHWLRPDTYIIFDSYVEKLLKLYNKEFSFASETGDMRDYAVFKSFVDSFVKHFDLHCSYRQLDKFLWWYGSKEIFGDNE